MSLPVAILAGGLATRLQPITQDVPKALVDVDGQPFAVHQIQLLRAHGLTDIVLEMLNTGVAPDSANDGTPPALYRAAEAAELDVLSRLLERGALPNGVDRKSWLPLSGAVRSGDPDVVKALLDAGASPKAKPAGGGTLAQQARGPFAEEIRILIETAPTKRKHD